MKIIVLFVFLFTLAASSFAGTVTFTITKDPDIGLNSGDAHTEEVWNFTTLPGWNQGLDIISVELTETFSDISGGSSFQSSVITYTPTLADLGSQTAIYFLFEAQAPSATEQVTLNAPYPCCTDTQSQSFSVADITGDGVLGQFDTRVARNDGSFTIETLTMTITAEVPEPATAGTGAAGIFALAWFARRKKVVGRI